MGAPEEAADPPAGTAFEAAVRLLRRFAPAETASLVIGLVLILAHAGLALLQPWPLKLVIDGALAGGPLPGGVVSAAEFAQKLFGFGSPSFAQAFVLAVAQVLLHLVLAILGFLSNWVLVRSGLRMVSELRCLVFDHLQRLSLRFHDTTTVGDSLYRVTWSTYAVQSLFNGGLVPCITQSVTLIGITAMMFSRDPLAALVALAVGVPLVLVLRRLDRPLTERSLSAQERESEISTRVQETLAGIRAVKAFGREDFETARFRAHADASLRANLRLTLLQTASQGLVGLVLAVGTAAAILVGADRVASGRMTPGDLVLLVSYVAMIHRPLESLMTAAVEILKSGGGAKRVLDLLDAEPDVADRTGATEVLDRARGELRFEGVAFEYRPGVPVLDGVDLVVPAGTRVALVGPSGAGKTTLASLALRFYDPSRGTIRLDGRDLREWTVASLRRQMAIVLQDPVLFSASVRENIAYGRAGATEAEIERAAALASADEFIRALPQGYDTPIGERGVSLSGGQRQRLSIARAFLKDAPILIMDEPTSALDAATEARLVQATERLLAGRTTLVIAHRLSTIRSADLIVVLDGGRVAELGSHAALLAQGGLYARLHAQQFGAAKPASDG